MHVSAHLDAGDESVKQLAFADVILLNKTDLVTAAALDALERRIRGINAVASIKRTRNCDVPLASVLDIGGFNLGRATSIDPGFLEPEYPFEWAGAYSLPAGTHALVIGHPGGGENGHGHDHGHDHADADGHHHHHHGNEDELDVAVIALPSLAEDAIASARDSAVAVFSGEERRVKDGERIAPGPPLNRLLLAGGCGSYSLEAEKPGLFLVFEGCGEEPLHIHVGGETVKPTWQADYHLEHEHSEGVSSVGIQQPGELDGKRLNEWISALLRTKGNDIYRMKGVLSVRGAAKRLVFQGIHMLFDAKFDREWGKDPRVNTLVFIGKNLDRAALTEAFKGCLSA
jgi:G3E family GTPase